MASNFESSIHRGSDLLCEFSCFTCQENDRVTEAEFYCEECSKLFCDKCIGYHNYLFKKHTILGKVNISQWPVSNVDAMEECQEHKKELTGFCEDHNELICHVCHVYNHQKCSNVVIIADKVKDLQQKGEFKQFSMTVDTLHQQLMQKKDDFDENLKSLENSFNKIQKEINAVRKAINDSLDQLEKNTIKELNTLLDSMRTAIQTDIKNCTESINNIKCVQDDWLRGKDKSVAICLIMYRQCLDQSLKTDVVLQEMKKKNEMTLTFNADLTIKQMLSTLSGLGPILCQVNTETRQTNAEAFKTFSNLPDSENQMIAVQTPFPESTPESCSAAQLVGENHKSDQNKQGQVSDPASSSSHQLVQGYQPGSVSRPDQIIKVKSRKKYKVQVTGDKAKCSISGICETASGELLITDRDNKKVKLLDQTYKVVDHCDLPGIPRSICSINSSQVAVAVDDCGIHFIRVTNGQLIKERTLKLAHICIGIAHHQGNLYITSGTALYQYTMDGKWVSNMYENKPQWGADFLTTVSSCAVSPDGDRIYVANRYSNQLVTLSRDGTVISTLTDPALYWGDIYMQTGIHVTDSEQVLVCGGMSNTIIQVERDGRHRLAEIVTEKDGVNRPTSVYYSKHTGTLVVGMMNEDDIMVFQTQ